jgi:hypothetical protein
MAADLVSISAGVVDLDFVTHCPEAIIAGWSRSTAEERRGVGHAASRGQLVQKGSSIGQRSIREVEMPKTVEQ